MANPILKKLDEYNSNYEIIDEKSIMTVSGTMNSFFVLSILAIIPALISWQLFALGYTDKVNLISYASAIIGLILALIVCFKPKTAPYLSPIYAVCEGAFLGATSALLENLYNGIVTHALSITLATAFAMFFVYKLGLIKATSKFRSVIITLTISIAITYLIGFIASLLGYNALTLFFWGNSIPSIVVSVIICAVAALNLILDFDNIEYFSESRAPSYMNWYCAFGLLVTIIWLYFEILKLLAKLQRR